MRALFASHLGEPPSAPLIVDGFFTGVPIALVPSAVADGDHISAPESAWANLDARDDTAGKPLGQLASPLGYKLYGDDPSPARTTQKNTTF